MGERGNIVIEKDDHLFSAPVFFYTHWTGYKLKPILQSALKRGEDRLDDPSYLARIIFSEMIQGHVLDETGFGISTKLCDNSYPLLCVNLKEQKIRERKGDSLEATPSREWTYAEFLAQKFDSKEED